MTLSPFWTHVILLSVSVLASCAVAAGIVIESKPFWRLATLLVVCGVAIEAVCTILLFVYDEGISNAQQSTIAQLLTPRRLSDNQKDKIARAIKPFPPVSFVAMTNPEAEPWDLALDISATLREDGWVWLPFPTQTALQPLDGRPSEGITIADHIEIQAPPALRAVAKALADAIRDPDVIGMKDVRVVADSRVTMMTIIVGSKK